jgi:hypothetical protein
MKQYCIFKFLVIEHTNGISYISLPLISHKWYTDDVDSDSDNDNNNNNNIDYLKPREPILIYSNNEYIKEKFKNKYEILIKNKINEKQIIFYFNEYQDIGILTDINNIIKITKIERRHLF